MSTNGQEANINPMGDFFRTLFEKVLDRALEKRKAIFPAVDEETARRIAQINAKPRITIPEASLLLGCSTSHLYTKIAAAKRGKAKHPIPFLDLDGVYVLQREELLKWAMAQKECRAKRCEKGSASDRLPGDFSGRSKGKERP